jgi:ubiquinone/menaquinone biosynthesis C-methylase UbiE
VKLDSPLAKRILDALPPIEPFPQGAEATYYGAHFLIADQLGITTPPPTKTTWSHGWQDAKQIVSPHQLISFGGPDDRHLVSNHKVKAALEGFDYRHVHAVGLPIVYADPPPVERVKGTLLVMPPHSLAHTRHKWPFEEYARQVSKLRDRFELIVLCLHPSCLENGYWHQEFTAHGIPWITGAAGHDRNALKRMQTLLRSFEFVTSNSSGSHLVYAAYCGAKLSLWGPYAEFEAEDYERDPFFAQHPDIKEVMMADARRGPTQARWPHLFVEPDQAVELREWGAAEVGADCRRTPEEIAALFGWDVAKLRGGSRPKWKPLPRVLPVTAELGAGVDVEIDGLSAQKSYLLAVVVASSSPVNGKTARVYGRVWPLEKGTQVRASLQLSTSTAELGERKSTYSWNEETLIEGAPYRLWLSLYEAGNEAPLLEQIVELSSGHLADPHAEKDIAYHQQIAGEYDLVVVAPREITNTLAFARFTRSVPRGRAMLDLGCGTGHMSLRFGERFERVVAVDHSEAMLAQARRKASLKGLTGFTAICDDALRFIVEAKSAAFDFISCADFVHHLEPGAMTRLFTHVARALTPRGVFLLQEPIEVPPGSVPPRVQKWNATSVATRLDYTDPHAHEADPDEAPLKLPALMAALSAGGLEVTKLHRNWEIFPQRLPATPRDWLGIAALNAAYGSSGNVLALAARRR